MTFSEIVEVYYGATETLSTQVRQLAFAGIAVIWIVRVGDSEAGGLDYTSAATLALFLFLASLSLDLLQYVYKSAAYWWINRSNWKEGSKMDEDVHVDPRWNVPTIVFFWLKTAVLMVGYGVLFVNLARQL